MSQFDEKRGLTLPQRTLKRLIDALISLVGLALLWWLILLCFVVATIDTREWGFYTQRRVGRRGRLFRIIKIRTMRTGDNSASTVTTSVDPRVTRIGRWLRRLKFDELPQILNVLKGDMSLVGPRPDVQGFADRLRGKNRIVLTVRPGITGPATLRFRDEEKILAETPDPETYNREVIFPEKVRLNTEYVEQYSVWMDFLILMETVSHQPLTGYARSRERRNSPRVRGHKES